MSNETEEVFHSKYKRSVIISIVTTILFLIMGSAAIILLLEQRQWLAYALGGYFLLSVFFLSLKLMLVRVLLRKKK
jgi:hypothetical protein